MEDNDDDYFSDDFDSLPPGTLHQLEQNAFQATQAPATQQYDQSIVNEPVQARPSTRTPATLKPPPRLHTGLTNDYDTLEVGELEAEIHDNVDGQSVLPQDHHVLIADNEWSANGGMGDVMEVDDEYGQANAYELNARLEQIEQEREQMRRELAEAKMLAETKAGEIAIIRSKQTRMAEEYDRQLVALRKTMTDEATKHREEVEAAMSEGKMLATENIFLQHDLAEEAHQLRNYKTKHQAEEKAPPMTPKKSRVLPFRDGFDDDEIAAVSPSKSATRSKRATPTVPGKRKRQASVDSAPALQLSPAGEMMMVDAPDDTAGSSFEAEHNLPGRTYGRDHQLIKRLLNHRMFPGQETDLEALTKYSFPSEPSRPLSSIVMDQLVKLDLDHYLLDYMYAIGPLWQRALTERFYDPVPRFASITRYILMMDDVPLLDLIAPLVGVLQDSVEVNAVPRFRYSPAAREKARVVRQTPQSDLQPVDSTEALRLLYHMACELLHVKGALEGLWRHIRHTFILVMLHGSQPLKDIMLVLQLLSTSIRPDSFGPIMSSEQEQTDVQRYIVDRLTHMLSESAQPDEGVEPYTAYDICAMRLEVLILLESLSFNPTASGQEHGSSIIAAHPNALPRLFRSMHDELDALYSSPPEHNLRVALVNGLMRLIFGVMRRHGQFINMQEKLACVPGTKQKHLVVLTRLAFCDGSVLEAGIDDETVDMAHELLEEWTNPQEAESLAEAFPSSRRD
ncbi:hypothetical protein N7448_005437 [Penicillium atrosanguineum]|uniref:DNA repair protein Rad26 n=1 Tax=Penicillium atrosanguineum TaxID=1132637 RepID=A0A9W9PNI6_9EURO|nr:Pre-mRNA-splicing factor syf2 [Penicillium atrosanguineum]KAJ5126125.1 hypothetical protein N7526_008302 [Penicillium atrosanguineum]KAJ5136883.1 hypothetical protein N7448_005437 [Penicillium atrosanguineum]KAJ5293213.1 Pre-mRNA-splicing factor syf2 [Penicillium atrosanguineum]KAJ5302751.1 hypothetical protein N7476_009550 [Penicillium atrosanguineum]